MIKGQTAIVVDLHSAKKKKVCSVLTPQAASPLTVTLCGNRVFADVIKLASY